MCQEFPKEKWIDAQKENVLDAPYYHVVFTVPEELNSIIYSNQKLLYDALPSLTVEKQKNGCKASKINACSRFLFRNDMCYCAIFFTLW